MGTQVGARDAGVTLRNLEDGQLLLDFSARLHELMTELADVAKVMGLAKGELWLKLKMGVEQGGTVQVDSEIVVKRPKTKRARTMMWLSKEGHLLSENPKQKELFPREVATPAAPREIPASADPRSV